YLMGSAIYIDPQDGGIHTTTIKNDSVLHGSIISGGAGSQTISMSDSTMDNGGIYAGSEKSNTTISLTNASVNASTSEIAKNIARAASAMDKFKDINLDAFSDVAIG